MKNHRRDFLKKTALLGIGATSLGACTRYLPSGSTANFYINHPKLPKVVVSRKRVIKETVGLRPFRQSGPRVELQELGKKTIVHNYGHGGSGWSLSWGTAMLATELIEKANSQDIAVIGCGISGLSTARTLQNRGYQVTIYTKEVYPNVTSALATGTWSPASRLLDPEKLTPEFAEMFQTACQYSYDTFQRLLGIQHMVDWMESYSIRSEKPPVGNYNHHELHNNLYTPSMDFYPRPTLLAKKENPFKLSTVYRSPTTIFNIPTYMKMLRDDFLLAGGKIEIRAFGRQEDIDALPQSCIANCTGLGSRELFGDEELMPISGQLAFLVPQPELNYRASMSGVYFIPRQDGVMLGGNGINNNWDTTPDTDVTDRYLEGVQEMMRHLRS
ncbi:FAD-binding oxidoreductase [Echinicola strongylocentroti]|uniref:D-amino-acid oxidase n=1 Tax=Echinicola strongylocentroti TaxID=1795355 RepID=A0A2Z4IL99_9BACT|nr:FAD-dependent oxidoreductase [Echinicola strongylocentroti]AWW31500.1 FAD-binding oxidoreductase [Echinicola strongylocentroti]